MSENNKSPKVICVGWHKTGTSTMGMALIKLGYTVLGARTDLAEQLLQGNKDIAIQQAAPFGALQDVPWAALYKELDEAFPGSKFILTERDEQQWLNSAAKHFQDSYSPMRKWLYGEGVLLGNEKCYMERYRLHNQAVKAYFKDRPEDFLMMSFEQGDGWEKLCSFLQVPTPSEPFPHANKGKHNYSFTEKIYSHLRDLIPVSWRERRFEILQKLGFADQRDPFNNQAENRKHRASLKNQSSNSTTNHSN